MKMFDFRGADSDVEDGSASKRWPRCPGQGTVQPAIHMDRTANQHTYSTKCSTWVSKRRYHYVGISLDMLQLRMWTKTKSTEKVSLTVSPTRVNRGTTDGRYILGFWRGEACPTSLFSVVVISVYKAVFIDHSTVTSIEPRLMKHSRKKGDLTLKIKNTTRLKISVFKCFLDDCIVSNNLTWDGSSVHSLGAA